MKKKLEIFEILPVKGKDKEAAEISVQWNLEIFFLFIYC